MCSFSLFPFPHDFVCKFWPWPWHFTLHVTIVHIEPFIIVCILFHVILSLFISFSYILFFHSFLFEFTLFTARSLPALRQTAYTHVFLFFFLLYFILFLSVDFLSHSHFSSFFYLPVWSVCISTQDAFKWMDGDWRWINMNSWIAWL